MNILKYYLNKLKGNPLSLIKRSFTKLVVEPLKYGKKGGYKAQEYWDDRFSKFGDSILGPGDQTFSKDGNLKMYKEAESAFVEACKKEIRDFEHIKVLEIGCGTGFYTAILKDLGVKDYTAVDISDVLFTKHRKKFPGYHFLKKDVTKDKIEGAYDLIVMIDVIEHIVEKEKFRFAMANVRDCMAPNGTFLLTPVSDKNRKHLYYVRFWSFEDIVQCFPGCTFRKLVPFRISSLLTVKNES